MAEERSFWDVVVQFLARLRPHVCVTELLSYNKKCIYFNKIFAQSKLMHVLKSTHSEQQLHKALFSCNNHSISNFPYLPTADSVNGKNGGWCASAADPPLPKIMLCAKGETPLALPGHKAKCKAEHPNSRTACLITATTQPGMLGSLLKQPPRLP